MTEAIFFRLLSDSLDEKGQALANQIANVNSGEFPLGTFSISENAFRQISGSPFAYWANALLRLMREFSFMEPSFATVIRGPEIFDLEKSMRIWTEVLPQNIGIESIWVDYAKGGESIAYASNTHLVVDYGSIRDGKSSFRRPGDRNFYFLPGLTFTQRTTKAFKTRVLHSNTFTSPKGPGILPREVDYFWYLLAISNSNIFNRFVELKVGAADTAARSYDLHILRNIPIPEIAVEQISLISRLGHQSHDLQRQKFVYDETTHVFQLPALIDWRGDSLSAANLTLEELAEQKVQALAELQAQIDETVFDLYGLNKTDRQTVLEHSIPITSSSDDEESSMEGDVDDDEDEDISVEGLLERAQNMLMWIVGVAFGRWDVLKALDQSLIPPLPQPFDPLPRCAPGALMGEDGLPLEKDNLPVDYPLAVAWDGILLDDPAQENTPNSLDIVARVREVLNLLWPDSAHRIEDELCQILGVQNLRDYFRHPTKGFFSFHIKRYTKSRRKAPIYWLLQSEKKSTGLWLYYPRIVEDTLFIAEDLLYKKLRLEQNRLDEFKQEHDALSGGERKKQERKIDQQSRLSEEISEFYNSIRRLANLKLPPDHNDGVLISLAPLHELVPWKEARAMWQKLERGEFAWSGMSEQLRKRGLIAGEE